MYGEWLADLVILLWLTVGLATFIYDRRREPKPPPREIFAYIFLWPLRFLGQ